jgi:4-amino-4-deoxy-L-arabinose transferase-like glycosyltransferase
VCKKKSDKGLILLLLAIVFYNAFFINKAFHIDDPFTIDIARAVNYNFFHIPRIFFSNPILLGYYYAPVIRFFGEKEIWLHIFSLPFTLLAIVAMYFLSRRFVGKTLIPAVMLTVTPAFIVMSQTVMLDIPMLAFFLIALHCFIYGIDNQRKSFLFLAGILAGAAILIKYSALMLIPLMFFYGVLFSRKRSHLLCLFIPVSIFGLWALYNLLSYKDFSFIQALLWRAKNCSVEIIMFRLFACFSFISGTSIFIFLVTPLFLKKVANRIVFLISMLLGIIPFALKKFFAEYTTAEKFFLAMLFLFSCFMILLISKAFWGGILKQKSDKENIFLSFWFLLLLIFTIFIQFIAARFVLLLFPAMILFICKELQNIRRGNPNIFKKTILAALAVSAVISTILAIGDYQFAGIYRDFISHLKEMGIRNEEVDFGRESRVPYCAWGYAYYLESYFPATRERFNLQNKGYKFLVLPQEKVLPFIINNLSLGIDYSAKEGVIEESVCKYPGHIFIHNRMHKTGFYSHDWGLLPFKICLKAKTIERFGIYRLK